MFRCLEGVWLKGVVICFQRYNLFKTQTTLLKSKNTCFFVGTPQKKNQSYLQTKHSRVELDVIQCYSADFFSHKKLHFIVGSSFQIKKKNQLLEL
jgi:hypothetical protein